MNDRRRYCLALICSALFFANEQQGAGQMPAIAKEFSGIVTDGAGNALPDVSIDHTGIEKELVTTDQGGRFHFKSSAPAIVFRKDGFDSEYLRTAESRERELKVVLSGTVSRFPHCASPSHYVALSGFEAKFLFPRIPGVKISSQSNDSDYGQRFFKVKTSQGKFSIQHASGLMWGSGLPSDDQVWSSKDYSETSYIGSNNIRILDARGIAADGTCWRLLGRPFETAAYSHVPQSATLLLDRVLNGACEQ